MSEFRKHRLISKLLDFYGLSADPTPFIAIINTPPTADPSSPFAHSSNSQPLAPLISQLSETAADKPLFSKLVEQLYSCPDLPPLLVVLSHLQRLGPLPSMQSNNGSQAQANSVSEHMPKLDEIKRETYHAFHSSSFTQSEDLEDLANKLNSISHRIGQNSAISAAPISNVRFEKLAVPISLNDQSLLLGDASQDFLKIALFRNEPNVRIGNHPVSVQEYLLVEDLLYVLLGISGTYFGFSSKNTAIPALPQADCTCLVDESIDATLLQMCKPVLRLAICYRGICAFLQKPQKGRTSQALSSCLQVLIQEYRQLIGLLEKKFFAKAHETTNSGDTANSNGGELKLHQFCFHLAPFAKRLQILFHITTEIDAGQIYGGAILRILESILNRYPGDRGIRSVLEELLIGSSTPFLQLLKEWMQTGRIREDVDCEFMFQPCTVDERKDPFEPENDKSAQDFGSIINLNWTVQKEQAPLFLDDLVGPLTKLGCYRRILGKLSTNKANSSVPALSFDQTRITMIVQSQLNSANEQLVTILFKDDKLIHDLQLAKRILFLEQSDFGECLLDLCHEELAKPVETISMEAIQACFEHAIASSSVRGIKGIEQFYPKLATVPLTEQLLKIIGTSSNGSSSGSTGNSGSTSNAGNTTTSNNPNSNNTTSGNGNAVDETESSTAKSLRGIKVFSIGMRTLFSSSLLLSPQNLTKYELLFRFQLSLLDLSRELSIHHRSILTTNLPSAVQLRRNLLLFVQGMRQYLCYQVFETQWNNLVTRLNAMSALIHTTATSKDSLPSMDSPPSLANYNPSIDEIVTLHEDYLDSCLRAALLTNAKLIQLVSMIITIGTRFVGLEQELVQKLGPSQYTFGTKTNPTEEIESKINILNQAFLKYIRILLEALQYYAARDCDHYLGYLLTRLDYNGFYYLMAQQPAPANTTGAIGGLVSHHL